MKLSINKAFSGGTPLLKEQEAPRPLMDADKRGSGVSMNFIVGVLLAVLGIFILWLYAIAPQLRGRPYMAELSKYDYAHRGLHNAERGIPENSLAAFRLAAESGFGIELDVQLTADNQVVVVHDPSLGRVCGVETAVKDMSLSQLQACRLEGTEEGIPTLKQALDAIGRRTPVIVELKYYNNTSVICPLVWEILKDYEGLYCVQSFNPLIVKWFRDHHPEVIRGQLMEGVQKNDILSSSAAFAGRNLLSNFLTRPNFEAYKYQSRSRPSMWLAKNVFGMPEISWTVTDMETYHYLKNQNCIVIFEGFEPFAEKKPVPAANPTTEKATGTATF